MNFEPSDYEKRLAERAKIRKFLESEYPDPTKPPELWTWPTHAQWLAWKRRNTTAKAVKSFTNWLNRSADGFAWRQRYGGLRALKYTKRDYSRHREPKWGEEDKEFPETFE